MSALEYFMVVVVVLCVLLLIASYSYGWGLKAGKNASDHEIEGLQDIVVHLEERLKSANERDESFYRNYGRLENMCLQMSNAHDIHVEKIKKLQDELLDVKVENRRLKKELIGEELSKTKDYSFRKSVNAEKKGDSNGENGKSL